MRYLVAELSELALGLAVNIRTLLRLGEVTASGLLALVVSLALNLPTLLKSVDAISIVSSQCHDNHTGEDVVGCNVPRNDILVLPANLMAETANGAVLATGAQTQDTEGLGNDNALLLVIGRGDTLEDLQALHSSSTAGGLVGNHAADSLVEDAGGSAEVEGTTASGVETGHLAEVGVVLHCRSTKDSILALRSPPIVIRIFPKSNIATTAKNVLLRFVRKHFRPWQGMKGIGRELNVRFARKNSPEMLRASHLTTTIFWPLSSCLATVLARRPRRCPLPSMTTYNPETLSQRSQSFRVFHAKVEDVEDLRFEV